MMRISSFRSHLARVFRHWEAKEYDAALSKVESLLKSWPGNPRLHILWASLVQLQDQSAHGLDKVKRALRQAIELDRNSPEGPVEFGHYLDAVEDDPQSALKVFSEGTFLARRLLIDGLIGQARVLVQLNRREEAFKCLMESLYLANIEYSARRGRLADSGPDILLRDPEGQLLGFQLKGPYAVKIGELLEELYPRRSA